MNYERYPVVEKAKSAQIVYKLNAFARTHTSLSHVLGHSSLRCASIRSLARSQGRESKVI